LGAEKAKICLRNRKRHRRPKERNDNGEDPHRSDLSGVAIGNVEKASFDRSSNERIIIQVVLSPSRLDIGMWQVTI
jgi:hypothetical protein